jgi:hypothetical protein
MDRERGLVAALLREGKGAVRRARERGIKPDHLSNEGSKLLEFVYDYTQQYGELPSVVVLEAKSGVILDDPIMGIPDGTADFFVDQILEARLFLTVQEGVATVTDYLDQKKSHEAMAAMASAAREARRSLLTKSTIEQSFQLGDRVLKLYEDIKSGKRGIQTPWATINEETFGLWPQDLFLMVARLGKGKTWLATCMAHQAWWVGGHKVLFATTEMAKEKIYQRMCALHLKLPYDDVRKGRLDAFSEQRFRDGIKLMAEKPDLYIAGGDFDFQVEAFQAAVEEVEPELVILDGAYLLKVDGASRTERMANGWDTIKRLAHSSHCPFFVTMQFNRDVKGNKAEGMDPGTVALSDVAGWNADVMYGLYQTDEMKKAKRAGLKPLKLREGAGVNEMLINFDFEAMDFTEIGGSAAGASDADTDFDAVIGTDPGDASAF